MFVGSVWRVIITSVPAVYRPTSVHTPSADECPQSFSLDVLPPAGSDRDGDRKNQITLHFFQCADLSVYQSMTTLLLINIIKQVWRILPWTSSQLVFVIINQLQSRQSASTNKPKHMVRFCQKSTCWHLTVLMITKQFHTFLCWSVISASSCFSRLCGEDIFHTETNPQQFICGLMLAHLLDHADELGEGPVELVQDAVEEGGGHVFVHTQQLRHVSLQQQRRTGLCTNRTTGRGQHREISYESELEHLLCVSVTPQKKKKRLLVSTQTHDGVMDWSFHRHLPS